MALRILPKTVQLPFAAPQLPRPTQAKAPEPTRAAAQRPLQMTYAKIDEELPALESGKFAVPWGYRSQAPVETRKHTATAPDGRKATLEWSDQSLNVRDGRGESVVLVPKDASSYEELSTALDEAVQAAQSGDDAFPHDWFSSATVLGVGSAGKLISVRNCYEAYTGGAHPYGGSMYSTYDVRTGQPVTLDQLLTAEQFRTIVEQVQRTLPRIDEHGTFTPMASSQDGVPTFEDWANQVKANFAVVSDGRDRYIRVGWESGVHALGPLAARFTFKAPADAAFLEKIGER